jgi:surfactin synthase thioesterase subunit
VTRYLTNEAIRSATLESVFKLIGPETKVLIGHSLGSVVAYEAAHRMQQPLRFC